jgi:hypothetical protein
MTGAGRWWTSVPVREPSAPGVFTHFVVQCPFLPGADAYDAVRRGLLGLHSTAGTTMTIPLRTLAMGLLLVSGAAQAGWFSHKSKPAPPPPPAPVVVPVLLPPPPPPIPLEFSGIQTAAPVSVPLDRLMSASPEVQSVAQWVGSSHDNAGLPFIVVDKVNAQVYAFNPSAQLKATAPILLGMGRGDEVLVPSNAPMSAIPPEKRITPAGRYLSNLVTDSHGKQVLSIDYKDSISLHIVVKGTPAQQRAARLASVTSDDNRISFGCINVPPGFFTEIVSPDFTPARGIVYVLPETRSAAQWFGFQPPVTAPSAPQAAMTATAMQTSPTVPQASPMSGDGASAAPAASSK